MKPDIYYQNAAKEWLARAKDDISWTESNIKSGFYTQACFTFQQVAEKSLKAYLRSQKKEIDKSLKTHQLSKLLHECRKFDSDFLSLLSNCRILNEYYAPTRYPEILGLEFRGYSQKQAHDALDLARQIFEFVERKLVKAQVISKS